jgi:signal transduction histidine kinase
MINDVFNNTKALLNYSGLLIIILCLFMLKKSTNLKNPMRVLSYSSAFLITGGVYLSGGFASNDILWYVVSSVSSLLFIGIADGIIMTILSIAAIIGFYIIDVEGVIELPYDTLTRSIHYRFANAMIIIIILFFLMWVLVRSNNRLQRIIEKIQKTQIRESISQDFHDELGNKLASVVHISKRLKDSKSDEEKQTMLEIIESESQQVYDNFRDFIWSIEPNNLTAGSLFMYMTDFNQQFFAYKDIQIEGKLLPFDYKGDEIIPSNIVRHIIPLFKELMTNIYKHSNANRVDWFLIYSENKLSLNINDNGRGFDPNKIAKGTGLKSIYKRCELLNSKLYINSKLGEGTQFALQINLI